MVTKNIIFLIFSASLLPLSLSPVISISWVLRFSRVLNEYSKTLKPKTCGVWNADETLILTKRGQDKNKLNKNYD